MMTKRTKTGKSLTPLVDADILRYEVGFGAESREEDKAFSFDACITLLEKKIKEIVGETGATEPPVMYLTMDSKLADRLNERRVKEGKKPKKFIPNFREEVGVTKEYKGNRTGEKPIHFDNLTAYIISAYETKLAVGMEADDLMSVHQNNAEPGTTIICSRDKDLLITPGLHFEWSFREGPCFGPVKVSTLGRLQYKDKKFKGTGLKLFYSQLLMGDTADNIPGIPRKGPAFAYNLLKDCESEEELFNSVLHEYMQFKAKELNDPAVDISDIEGAARIYFKEQANLLWIIQDFDAKGNPIKYTMFDER